MHAQAGWGVWRGVIRISSDRDDRRIFGVFDIFEFGVFLGVENFGKYFLGLLDLSGDFFRVFKTI